MGRCCRRRTSPVPASSRSLRIPPCSSGTRKLRPHPRRSARFRSFRMTRGTDRLFCSALRRTPPHRSSRWRALPMRPVTAPRPLPPSGAQAPPLAAVANAASYGTGPVSAGELVSLGGNGLGPPQGIQLTATPQTPYPTQAGNVEVTFDGIPAPLLWVQDAQINAAVPWEVAGPTTQVCVTYNNVKTNCLTWPVAQVTPAVFMQDSSYAAALNQDGTPNSAAKPAQPNSIVSVFATGLGPISPAQPDGSLIGLPLPVDVLPITLESCTPQPMTGMCFPPLPDRKSV